MLLDIKKDFSRFLGMNPGRLHFAAHSHHFWPDVTFDAHQQAWMDAARDADRKWSGIFSDVIPAVQRGIAQRLNLPNPSTICFAPNTHEFVLRLLSCFPAGKKINVLTTDSEFYSFRRQTQRHAEDGLIQLTRIPAEPFDTFIERFTAAAQDQDLIFFSHVFFNSGFVVPHVARVAQAARKDAFVVIDGYHGFMAVPTDLSALADRIFYLAGGYKYAMAGEGACFMHCPPGFGPRPRDTGWFAEMSTLEAEKTTQVDYEAGGARFFGATFDPSGLYRMRAVFKWLDERGITVADIHQHVMELQAAFIEKTALAGLMIPDSARRGHFLTFRTPQAEELQKKLLESNIVTDRRGDRLRFGFGIYHDMQDIERLCRRLGEIL